MDWLPRRISNLLSASGAAPDESAPGPVERASPGAAALFEGISQDESHAVLDLGAAAGASLRVYSRFARRVRFADLLTARSEQGLAAALEALPSQPERPYDLLFAWNTLDRLLPRERSRLVQRLTDVSAPDARLHVVVDASEGTTGRVPHRFTLVDVDRMRCEPAGRERSDRGRLLPADVEELLSPFRVVRGFTLKDGLREYVAVRGEGGERRPARLA